MYQCLQTSAGARSVGIGTVAYDATTGVPIGKRHCCLPDWHLSS